MSQRPICQDPDAKVTLLRKNLATMDHAVSFFRFFQETNHVYHRVENYHDIFLEKCEPGDWAPWSECDCETEPPIKTRERNCDCGPEICNDECTNQKQTCSIDECPLPPPKECKVQFILYESYQVLILDDCIF